jgi:hypothetical protein
VYVARHADSDAGASGRILEMKVTYTVGINIENDWDNLREMGISGRKDFVGSVLRRAVMAATMRDVAPLLLQNGIDVSAIQVSDPSWEGWDNERIAQEIETPEEQS